MKIFSFALCVLMLAACARPAATVPESFHVLPENGGVASSAEDDDADLARADASMGAVTEDYVDATSSALEDLAPSSSVQPLSALTAPSGDHVPWHMEYLLTDLSVSASGLLGALTMKGTPAVTFIWRKQHAVKAAPVQSVATLPSAEAVDLSITSESTDSEMTMQLEPAIKMAVASGKVKDEHKLRGNLLKAARDFQGLASGVGENPGLDWWVSRLRLDLSFEANGNVTPVIAVGGDLRLRFEWHRLMRKSATPAPASTSARALGMAFGVQPTALREFVSSMSQDLSVISDEQKKPEGFKAYTFRVGLGMSAKGDIGIVKASASVIGQVYFARDVAKPKVHPSMLSASVESLPSTVNFIEDDVAAHEKFAVANAIAMDHVASSGHDQVVYKVDRAKLRKGLAKAAKIGMMFGKHSATSAKGKWKVYEFRTAFDLSISGKAGMTELAGLATSEIDFYNQSF